VAVIGLVIFGLAAIVFVGAPRAMPHSHFTRYPLLAKTVSIHYIHFCRIASFMATRTRFS
jgi:hypothetical protein